MSPRRLDFFPDRRRRNPYLDMLYGRLRDIDASARPTGPLLKHLESAAASKRPGVLHVHGAAPFLGDGADDEALARVDVLGTLLTRFVGAGGRLVWSVHDVVPQDDRLAAVTAEACRVLAEHARLVHVPDEGTHSALAAYTPLDPARVVVIPRSSFMGVYPDDLGREEARRRLGIGTELGAMVALGRLRPEGGLGRLLDTFERPPFDDPDLRLLVAGSRSGERGVRGLAERIAASPRVLSHPRRLARRDIQVWLYAGDLAVLPETNPVASGCFLLAETFGLPVVAPRAGTAATREGDPHVRLFDPDDFETVLAAAVTEFVHDQNAVARARTSALQRASDNPPELMAHRFAQAVAPLLSE